MNIQHKNKFIYLTSINLTIVFISGFFSHAGYAGDTYQFYIKTLQQSKTALDTEYKDDNLIGDIGQGWSSDNDSPVAKCLIGAIDHVGTPSGSLTLDTRYSYHDVLKQMNLSVDGRVSLLGFSLNANAKYANMLRDTALSSSFIYQASVLLKNRQFEVPNDRNPLTWIGQQYFNHPVKFRKFCGDQFITQQKIGGSLYVAIKFYFHNMEKKKSFDQFAKASFGNFISIEQNLSKLSKDIKQDGSVSVIAFQIGGDPTKLGQILGSPDGKTASVLTCHLNNVSACEATMGQVLNYASQNSRGNFPNQFNDANPNHAIGPGVIENELQDYGVVIPIEHSPSLVTPDIRNARKKLSSLYEKAIGIDNTLENLQQHPWPLSQNYISIINKDKVVSEKNLSKIREAGKTCYLDDLNDCVEGAKAIDQQLSVVDVQKVGTIYYGETPGGNFTDFYLYPYNDNQVAMFNKRFAANYAYPINVQTFNARQISISNNDIIRLSATSTNQGKTYQGTVKISYLPDIPVTLYAINLNEV